MGAPLALYNAPDNRFVAGFLGSPGMNFLPARREGSLLRGTGFELTAPASLEADGELLLGLRPQDLRVASTGPFRGTVQAVERLGFDGYAFLTTAAGPLVARFGAETTVAVGDQVNVTPAGDALHVFTADGGRALRHPEPPRRLEAVS